MALLLAPKKSAGWTFRLTAKCRGNRASSAGIMRQFGPLPLQSIVKKLFILEG